MADAPTYRITPSPVHDLVHNHLFPSTTAQVDSAQKTLQHLQSAVHDVDADLAQMRIAFQQLLVKRAALQDYADAHQRLVSPVHRLPTEILVGIFLHALAASSFKRHPDKAPLVLERVCRRWKDIARSTPELWSHIRLDL
ncbi:hypothetical protein FIBSPDRAFT_833591, partial [Athelia psychrophila]